jgi:RNA-directed DNA polymerase
MLCNVAGLEKIIRNQFPVNKTIKEGKPKVYICRYADDLIITGKDEIILYKTKELVSKFLSKRGLELKQAKTRIVNIRIGFDFLGFNISRKKYNPRLNNSTEQKTVLIIKPSYKSVENIITKIKNIIRQNNAEIKSLISEINPVLRG